MVAHHDHQQLPQQGEQARKGMQEKLSGQRLAGAVTRTTRTSLMQPPVDGQHLKVLEFPPSKVPPSKMQKTSSNFDLTNMTAWKLTKQTDNMCSKRMIRLQNDICDKSRKDHHHVTLWHVNNQAKDTHVRWATVMIATSHHDIYWVFVPSAIACTTSHCFRKRDMSWCPA